jgi:hypothetical protein
VEADDGGGIVDEGHSGDGHSDGRAEATRRRCCGGSRRRCGRL